MNWPRTVVAFGLLGVTGVGLRASGGGELAIPLPPEGDLLGWLDRTSPVVVAVALVRLVGLGLCGYLTVALLAAVLAQLLAARHGGAHVAGWLVPLAIRRLVARGARSGLTTGVVLGWVGSMATTAHPAGAQPPPATAPVTDDPAAHTATMTRLGPDPDPGEAEPATATMTHLGAAPDLLPTAAPNGAAAPTVVQDAVGGGPPPIAASDAAGGAASPSAPSDAAGGPASTAPSDTAGGVAAPTVMPGTAGGVAAPTVMPGTAGGVAAPTVMPDAAGGVAAPAAGPDVAGGGVGSAAAPSDVAGGGAASPVASASSVSGDWVVEAGESFWSIAEEALTEARGGVVPPEHDVARYWQRLVAANHDRLAAPGNPDLLLVGQVVRVPPPDHV